MFSKYLCAIIIINSMFQSIKSRLFALFLLSGLTSITLFLISFYYIQKNQNELSNIDERIDKVYNYMLRDIKVTRDFFSNETINSTYFETGKSVFLDNHKQIEQEIRAILSSLTDDEDHIDPVLLEKCRRATEQFSIYSNMIDVIVFKINTRGFKDYRLEGRMRELAHNLENLSEEIGLANILKLRKHEKDFIIRQDEIYLSKFHDQADIIKKEISSGHLAQRRKKHILDDLKGYESKFDSLVLLDKLIGLKNQGGLKKKIDLQAEKTETILQSASALASEQGQAALTKIWRLSVFFWILIAILGIFISTIFSDKISASIVTLKKGIAEFVESDFTKRTILPIKNSAYEVDVLANHFSVLEQHTVNQMRTLRVKNKELEMFIYRASHDIKTPLTSIVKTFDRIKISTADKKTIEDLTRAGNTIEALNDIIEELAMVMSLKTNDVDVQEIDPLELTKKCINGFQTYNGFENIVFRTNIQMKNAFYSDKRFIKIILRNLIENSIKYQNMNRKNPFIDISFEEFENQMVKITVSDNGIGIKKDLQKNIFDIFFRANDDVKGNGLGLYIAQNALQKLQGAIKVKSEEGTGSSFIIYLPDAARKTNHAQRIIENKSVFPSREEFALDYL